MSISGVGEVADLIKDGLDKVFPDANEAQKAQVQLMLEQIKANEAAGPGVHFRDGAGWVCVVSFALTALKSPIEWGFAIAGHPVTLPSVDSSETTPMLLGLLGLAGAHVADNIWSKK